MRLGRRSSQSKLLRWVGLTVASTFVLALAGCGSDLAEVTGLVTLDGEPLRGGNGVRATVYFQPASGAGAAAIGLIDENGSYTLSSGSSAGVAPGDYLVSVSAAQIIPDKANPGGAASGRRITDSKYANAKTSGFQFTVEPGGNEFNLTLDSPHASRPLGSR